MKSLHLAARWIRSRLIDSALILGYHRVAEVDPDSFSMCVTPRHFTEHLKILTKYAHPIPLREVARGLKNGNLPKRAVALTFDDGYADVLHNAKPLLDLFQIPATVFVTTGYLGREFWWDILEKILLTPPALPARLSLPMRGGTYEWNSTEIRNRSSRTEALEPRQRLLLSLYRTFLPLASSDRHRAIKQLCEWSGADLDAPPRALALTDLQVTDLVTGGLVDVGAHSVTHPLLSALDLAGQLAEIHGSKAHLERLLGRPPISFSYPNGSLSQSTIDIVRDSGFACACASRSDVVHRLIDPFRLPRFWIPDCDEATFSRWLTRWLRK